MRNLTRMRLEDSYEIIDTGDPKQAFAMALEEKPDAILLDLMMPEFSGFELCQTLSSLSFTRNIPIFIVSGEDATKYKSLCRSLGAFGYFQKPVDKAQRIDLEMDLRCFGGRGKVQFKIPRKFIVER